ncbi:MAG: citramalate synthase, partial [Phycisphaerales bacterium]|jgi:2-isopropylmalate synthase|nr:citramalate synthase [Phycisphaerales bacterium]MBT7171944.1 citramalate synthase [Phycisphaerales bacterium]
MTNRIELYDTTLRDGTQMQGVNLSLKDKLELTTALDKLGVDYIECGYPLSNPKDAKLFEELAKRTFQNAKIAAFGMTRRRGVEAKDDVGMNALLDSGAPVITIVGKTWDLHLRDVLRVSDEDNIEMISDSVGLMVERGRECFYDAEHFFDGYASNPDYALETLGAALTAGASRLVLCDTNGGATTEQISSAITTVLETYPDAKVGVHCHNDSDLAVANSLAAITAGAVQVQGTINGIGERCGNANLVSLAANLHFKYGKEVLLEGSIENLTRISRLVNELANLNPYDGQPYVGTAAFAHKGGMHVHAVQRNTKTYEHIEPESVGNLRQILVSELSGVSNIAATVDPKFDIADDRDAQRRILERLMDLENSGYEFEAAQASMEMLVRKTLGDQWYHPLWTLDHYRCIIARTPNGLASEATVKLVIHDQPCHTVSEAEGPVDSLFCAMKSALTKAYPTVTELHLSDYRVRVINTEAGTAACVRVAIDWHDKTSGTYFTTVGVDQNVIDASWLALNDAIEYKLLSEEEADA